MIIVDAAPDPYSVETHRQSNFHLCTDAGRKQSISFLWAGG